MLHTFSLNITFNYCFFNKIKEEGEQTSKRFKFICGFRKKDSFGIVILKYFQLMVQTRQQQARIYRNVKHHGTP